MADHDNDLWTRVRELEEALLQQAKGNTFLEQQVHALFLVNAALLASLRDRDMLDVEQMRTLILEHLPKEHRDGGVEAIINGMLAVPTSVSPPSSGETVKAQLREAARARLTVIEGGRPEDG